MDAAVGNPAMIRAAVLPFRIVESLGVGCGYERSFKLARNSILANRYLLGLDVADVGAARLMDVCGQLNMPAPLMEELSDGLPDANLVFLGFEDSGPGGCIHKVYLEYWDSLKARIRSGTAAPGEPHLLHKGFKWHVDEPGKHVVTLYHCLPALNTTQIHARIMDIYRDAPDAAGLDAVTRVIAAGARRCPGERFLYVEVSEPGNPRKSFDLNLYPAGLRVGQVAEPIRDAARALDAPTDRLERLMVMIQDKHFGHVSGGVSRQGGEYFTIYYET